VFWAVTLCHLPQDSNPPKHRCQNFKIHWTIAISSEDGVIIPKHAVSINK